MYIYRLSRLANQDPSCVNETAAVAIMDAWVSGLGADVKWFGGMLPLLDGMKEVSSFASLSERTPNTRRFPPNATDPKRMV